MRLPFGQYRTVLATYLRQQRRTVALLGVLLFGSIALELLSPQILRVYIDSATPGRPLATLFGAAAVYLALVGLTMVVTVWATYTSEDVGWTATNALRADLALHCLTLDMSFHNARTPGELIERLDGDVTALANFFSEFVLRVAGNVLLLLGVLVLLAREDGRLGLAFAVLAALSMGVLARVQGVGVPAWEAARQASAEFFGFLEERLAGSIDIRSSAATPYMLRRFYAFMRARMATERKAGLMGSIMGSTTILLFTGSYALAFALGGALYRGGTLTIGTVYLVVQYIGMLERPVQQLTAQMQDLQKAAAGLHRIEELLHIRSTVTDGPGAAFPAGALAVDFRGVSFAYGAGEVVLHDVSFHLAAGQVLGLLGRTGSGKSTVARLLTRLYDPTTGTVRLGGVDLRTARVADVRARVGLVTQDIQLFHATVRDNLTFFDRTVPDERILAALGELGLGEWYRALPDGLETMLASGGGGLSAGEAQLVAFTRVFLGEPQLVILDEASSRLDPATERLVDQAVAALLRGRTGLIIAHRLATVQRADGILVLDAGDIAEYGPRAQLATDPTTRFFHLLQSGLPEETPT